METPRINAVGLVSYPADYEAIPRKLSPWKRLFAGVLVLFFFAVTVVTGTVTLGEYCLTSDGGDARILRDSLRIWNEAEPATLPQPVDPPSAP